MYFRRIISSTLVLLVCGLLPQASYATDYDESVSGDFSNSGLSTTSIVSLTSGSNQIFGTTGRGTNAVDRDYFTITVPVGLEIVSLTELPGTMVGRSLSFIGLEAGTQVTLPSNTATATGLLGWTHYGTGDINTDILPRMGIPSNGSSGFTPPLGPGDYSFWIQELSTGTFNYGFDIAVQATPEPGSMAILFGLGIGVSTLAITRLQRKRMCA